MRKEWTDARRLVVKIGSSLLIEPERGTLKSNWLRTLAQDIAALAGEGREILVVSSGAIALGRRALGLAPGRLRLEESQASAAVGQVALAHGYEALFREEGLVTAQVLLTLGDTEERRRYLNARGTIQTLFKLGVVPIVNENDTVATSEIRYGDNDRLAARVATMMSAHLLVVLSDVDGLYTAPPGANKEAHRIDEVRAITPEIEALAGATGTDYGSGGMVTKIEAAKIATAAGTHMVITSGRRDHPLRALGEGAPATWFPARGDPIAARKRWIGGALETKGALTIDAGAVAALGRGKSLLPAGVVAIEGRFARGDAVAIRGPDGREIGRGLVAYDSQDAGRIVGRKSGEIARILGYEGRAEIIHRDDMSLNLKGS